jgi:site-specific recombinase XerC
MKVKSPRLSNDAICQQWLAPYAKASSYTYQYSYEFLMEVLANKSLLDLNQNDILFVHDKICDLLADTESKNLQRTIRSKGVGIRSLLKYLFKQELIKENFASLINLKHPKLVEVVQERSIDYRFVDIWALGSMTPEERMLFWLVVFVRLPIVDVLAMTWADFHVDTRSIHLIGRDEKVTQVKLDPKVWNYLLEMKDPGTYQFDPVFDTQNKQAAKRTIDKMLITLGFADGIKCLSGANHQVILTPVFSLLS